MKDVRCMVSWHRWRRRQVDGATYVACTRCSAEKHSAASGWYGRYPG